MRGISPPAPHREIALRCSRHGSRFQRGPSAASLANLDQLLTSSTSAPFTSPPSSVMNGDGSAGIRAMYQPANFAGKARRTT